MAKNEIKVSVVVDDNGSIRLTEQSAKKLGKELDNTGTKTDKLNKKSGELDRNLKGVAGITSSTTKGFAKMSQGMGGLVSVYAGLAANVFALSAAFEFFKRAADLQNLREGQLAYAASTGVALKSVTSGLQEASDGMLKFEQAASAAAIGLAKGFTPQQLEALADGARRASTALGRNFEDAFDRLVRGVSKAEPELLDELGITLRLANATRTYAAAIGKTAKDLTEYERSQAVLVETQRQLNDLFGDVDPQANPYTQLAVTFDEIKNTVVESVLPAINGFADIINRSAYAAIAVFGGLAIKIAQTVLPLDDLKNSVKNFGDKARKSVDDAKNNITKYKNALIDTDAQAKKSRKTLVSMASDLVQGPAKGAKAFEALAQGGKINFSALKVSARAALESIEDGIVTNEGKFKGMTESFVRNFQTDLLQVEDQNKKTTTNVLTAWQRVTLVFDLIKARGVQAFAAIAAAAQAFALWTLKWVGRIVRALSFVGIASILFEVGLSLGAGLESGVRAALTKIDSLIGTNFLAAFEGSAFQSFLKGASDSAQKTIDLKDAVKKAESSIKNFREESVLLAQAFEKATTATQALSVGIKTITTAPLTTILRQIQTVQELDPDKAFGLFNKLNSVLERLGPAGEVFRDAIRKTNGDLDAQVKLVQQIQTQWSRYGAQQKSVEQAITDVQTKFQEFSSVKDIDGLLSAIESLNKQVGNLNALGDELKVPEDIKQLTSNIEALTGLPIKEFTSKVKNLKNETFDLAIATEGLKLQQQALAKLGPITKKFAVDQLNVRKAENDLTKTILDLKANEVALTTATSEAAVRARAQERIELELTREAQQRRVDQLKEEASGFAEYARAIRNSFETELSGIFQKIFSGEESSFKESIRQLALGISDSINKALAERATNAISVALFGEPEDEAQKLKNTQDDFLKKYDAIVEKYGALAKEREATALQQQKELEALNQKLAPIIKEAFSSASADTFISQVEGAGKTVKDAIIEGATEHARLIRDAISGKAEGTGPAQFHRGVPGTPGFVEDYNVAAQGSIPSEIGDSIAQWLYKEINDPTAAQPDAARGVFAQRAKLDAGLEYDRRVFIGEAMPAGSGVLKDPTMGGMMGLGFELPEQKENTAALTEATSAAITQTETANAVVASNTALTTAVDNLATSISAPATTSAFDPLQPGEDPNKNLNYEGKRKGIFGGTMGALSQLFSPVETKTTIEGEGTTSKATNKDGFIKRLGNVFGSFTDDIGALFSKDGGFLSGLGDIFSEGLGGFGDIFSKLLGGLFGGSGSESAIGGILKAGLSLFGFGGAAAMGGIFRGGIQAYAKGGIVDRPTFGLVGEGKMNEAVVPLPDGKAIPVNMNNGGNQQNNVAVNINMDSGKADITSDGNKAAEFGNLISQMVQREIVDQSRPGGLLAR